MQRDDSKKRSERDEKKRLSDGEDGLHLGEVERIRAEIARIQNQAAEMRAAFDRR